MEYRYFSHSGIGKRPKNEDCIVPKEKNGTSQSFVLCDGLGGNGDGDVAANFVAGEIYNQLEQLQTLAAEHAHAIVEQTSAALQEFAQKHGNPQMGTTLVFLKTEKNKALAGWVGDSRLYHFRGGEILFRTEDHSIVNYLAKKGALPGYHQHLSHIIWQAVGLSASISPDFAEIDNIQHNDIFLLVSDGVTEVWADNELAELSTNKAADIVSFMLHRCKEQARDNYTFTLVEAIAPLA